MADKISTVLCSNLIFTGYSCLHQAFLIGGRARLQVPDRLLQTKPPLSWESGMIDASQVWHDLHYTHCFASTWCQRSLDLLQGQRRWHPGGHKRCSCGRHPEIGLHELSRCRIRRQRCNQPRRTHTVPRKNRSMLTTTRKPKGRRLSSKPTAKVAF